MLVCHSQERHNVRDMIKGHAASLARSSQLRTIQLRLRLIPSAFRRPIAPTITYAPIAVTTVDILCYHGFHLQIKRMVAKRVGLLRANVGCVYTLALTCAEQRWQLIPSDTLQTNQPSSWFLLRYPSTLLLRRSHTITRSLSVIIVS